MNIQQVMRYRWLLLSGIAVLLIIGSVFLSSRLLARYGLMQTEPTQTTPDDSWPVPGFAEEASGLNNPVHVTSANDGSGRLFVVEQEGRIRIIRDGALLAEPLLDIVEQVSCCGERGLLSVAFPPDFATKQYFYVDYTNTEGNTVIARYRMSDDPDRADATSEEVLLTIEQFASNHNGGQLAFGPDGYLYIGMGDGGSSGDPRNNGQTTSTLLGALLRIDVETPSIYTEVPYHIPPDNPFVGVEGSRDEIWAYGLRNPWRFSFDRQTGELYIADVGQNAYEEISLQPADSSGGENYGWHCREGFQPFDMDGCEGLELVDPIFEYDHSQGDRSITGGFVYRGERYERMQGVYFYADFVSGRLWGLRRNGAEWENTLLVDNNFLISSFGEDEAGNLYLTDYSNGRVLRLVDIVSTSFIPLVVAE